MEGGYASEMYYVYLLICADKTLYTGYTVDLPKRFNMHNLGRGAKYTRSRLPVKLAYFETLPDKSSALKREREVKQFTRREKMKLIGIDDEGV